MSPKEAFSAYVATQGAASSIDASKAVRGVNGAVVASWKGATEPRKGR